MLNAIEHSDLTSIVAPGHAKTSGIGVALAIVAVTSTALETRGESHPGYTVCAICHVGLLETPDTAKFREP